MYQQILLPVALQQWDEFTPHALAAREVAAAIAKGSGARLSVLSVYDYGKIKEPGLSIEHGRALSGRHDAADRCGRWRRR